jgi:hypothetical protein
LAETVKLIEIAIKPLLKNFIQQNSELQVADFIQIFLKRNPSTYNRISLPGSSCNIEPISRISQRRITTY